MEFLMALLLAIGLWAVEPAGDEAFGVSAEEGEVTAMDGGSGSPPPPGP